MSELKEHQEKLAYKPNLETKQDLPQENEKLIVKEKVDKINNYSRYVREIFWPKVSVKKQLELEHIKSNLKNQNIRRSAQDLQNLDENGNIQNSPKKRVGGYERPWRKAMSKNPLSLDTAGVDSRNQNQGGGTAAQSPGPYADLKSSFNKN